MSEFTKKLAAMKDSWDGSKDQYDSMFGGAKLPAAEYIAQLHNAKLKESQAGNLMIAREWLIAEGQYEGTTVFDNMNLSSPMGFTFVRRWIEQMGYEAPENPEDIEEIVDSILEEEPTVQIRLTHQDEFTNIRIVKLIESEEGEEDEGEEDEGEESEEEESEEEESEEEESEEDDEGEEEESEEEESEKDDEEIRQLMEVFCATWNLDYNEGDSFDDLHAIISDSTYPEEELDDEEKNLLADLELEKLIEGKPAKKKKVAPKAAPKAKAKAAPKKKSIKKSVKKSVKKTRK